MASRALACSASYWPTLLHFSVPGLVPRPG